MRLKNILLAVKDVQQSKAFYKTIFGLDVILDGDENVILTEGLVLQDAAVWGEALEREITVKNHAAELYFEENDLERFIEKLEESEFEITYVTPFTELPWGQKLVRIYDLDGHLIEVRTPMTRGHDLWK